MAEAADIGRRLAKVLLIALLLCLTISAQTTAIDPAHASHHEAGHSCLLCHTGSLPFLRAVAPAVTPAFRVAWLAPSADFVSLPEALLTAKTSRAPPAS